MGFTMARAQNHLAVGHPAFDAAGPVGRPFEAGLFGPHDLVVEGGPTESSGVESRPDRHSLHRVDRHQGLGQASVQATVPVSVGPEAGRSASDHDLHLASDAVAVLLGPVDLGDHPLRHLGVDAANRGLFDAVEGFPGHAGTRGQGGPGHSQDVGADLDPGLSEEAPGEPSGRDPGGRLAGTGPLEDVSQVGGVVLQGPGEIRVPRPRVAQPPSLPRLVRLGIGRHDVAPVGEVAVADDEGHRAAEGASVPDAGEDLHRVLLDLHPAAAPVPPLPAAEIGVDGLAIDPNPGREPFDDDGQSRAVRLASGEETEHPQIVGQPPGACQETGRPSGSGSRPNVTVANL